MGKLKQVTAITPSGRSIVVSMDEMCPDTVYISESQFDTYADLDINHITSFSMGCAEKDIVKPTDKLTLCIGLPIISKLMRGNTVELDNVVLIPADDIFNAAQDKYGCVRYKGTKS